MDYAVIGFGPVGQALATMFARKGIDVMVATRRAPEVHAAKAAGIGPTVRPVPLAEALTAGTILLAIQYGQIDELAAATDWSRKTVIDVTNAYGVPVETLGGQPSSAVTARKLAGSRLVKAWNHLAAAKLATDPTVNGGRRVIFVSSDDADASRDVSVLVERLGFAPVPLGGLAEGGALVQARGQSWAPLIFQDLVKFA